MLWKRTALLPFHTFYILKLTLPLAPQLHCHLLLSRQERHAPCAPEAAARLSHPLCPSVTVCTLRLQAQGLCAGEKWALAQALCLRFLSKQAFDGISLLPGPAAQAWPCPSHPLEHSLTPLLGVQVGYISPVQKTSSSFPD